MIANFLALTAGLAATVSAFDCNGPYFSFYNRVGPAMSIQRLDPAVSPGQESSHLHSFDGGNGLALDTTFAGLQSSTCTSARIKPDNSLYWRPTLFWNGNNTGFYRVPEKYLKVYYKFGDAGNVRANVTEFPENFQMLAGDAFKRADGANPGGITWACLGPNYSRIETNGFPNGFTSCADGFTTQITFPSCWNGQDINPKNASAHMAYPSNSGTGLDACPTGFKTARFPTIFIEYWYDVSAFDGQYKSTDTPWVLAQGDPTGFGWHADFRNGWAPGVLGKAIAPEGYCNCGCGCGNDQMKTCFGQDQVNDDQDATFKSCAANDAFPGDDKVVLDKLPGCNPIQAGPSPATLASGPDCTAAAASAAGGSNSTSAYDDAVSTSAAASTSAVASATTLVSSTKAAATSSKKPRTSKTKTAASSTISEANDNVVYVTQVVHETVTAAIKHKRHGRVHMQ
ncbi:hypothetical protein P280DRAFT_56511 [Massarina eburnea CBS 473.64]|uniref:DUF1996 domain-containing protein n=1 Tax=Massarina eburnea CBS 473.64 TaxID=1395130 RepID=A0A6A6RXS5_9PLEO|nr:hypothetical protein P280DRAFT_56511 [Massarina eburnea CBS 473.64]